MLRPITQRVLYMNLLLKQAWNGPLRLILRCNLQAGNYGTTSYYFSKSLHIIVKGFKHRLNWNIILASTDIVRYLQIKNIKRSLTAISNQENCVNNITNKLNIIVTNIIIMYWLQYSYIVHMLQNTARNITTTCTLNLN